MRYEINRILDAHQAHCLKTGGTGIRYAIRVCGRDTYLWYEGPAWLVEVKGAYMPD